MRTALSRLLLAALVVAAIWAIARLAGGGGDPEAVVALTRLRADRLAHASFEVTGPGARVAVRLVGSVGPGAAPDGALALAAYGWIVRRDSAALAWRPSVGARPARGSVVEVRDTLTLMPGHYDVYFASFGDPDGPRPPRPTGPLGRARHALDGGGRAWVGEADRWRLEVVPASGADRPLVERRFDEPGPDPRAVAHARMSTTGQEATQLVIVERESRVRLRAVTEVRRGAVADSLDLVHLETGRRVWAASPETGTWAGGAQRNRAYDTTLVLAPGVYRLRAAADGAHGPDRWAANPPWAPAAWGVALHDTGDGAVSRLRPDTAEGLPEIARLDCVGPDQDRRVRFALSDTLLVVVEAVGEMSSASRRFDVGTLEVEPDAGPVTTLWSMPYDETTHAGGADRNRRGVDVRVLPPGTYALRYVTDDSHDCSDGFPGGPPDDPSFWGIRVGVLSPAFQATSVRRGNTLGAARRAAAEATGASTDAAAGGAEVLARIAGVGPLERRSETLRLAAPTEVRVVAVGELFPSERLDWGWIEDATGEIVWEMSRANTRPAGGAPQNRLADETLRLPAGTYTVRYQTNDRHDARSFEGAPPPDATAWGIRVERAPPGAR